MSLEGVRWVRQEDGLGCSIAVLAMITGLTYQEAREAVGFDGTLESSCSGRQTEWLKSLGYECIIAYFDRQGYREAYDRREEFIPTDRSYVLWLSVSIGENWHSVLQLPDGRILDPEHEEPRQLLDYDALQTVRVVTRVE